MKYAKCALLLPMMAGWIITPCVFAQEPSTTVQTQDIVIEPQPAAQPIAAYQRVEWFAKYSIGPTALFGATVSAGWGTVFNQPHEYGTHWEGFGDRYGMRITGIVTSNAMEASLGAIWGEDPRYARSGAGKSFGNRMGHIVKWTFAAPGRDGNLHPAYARYMGIAGSNFLSNTWREPSEADSSQALERTALGFLGRMASNSWDEFWPDAKKKLFHRGSPN